MNEDLARQNYVDYQLDLNETTHQKLWDRIHELEREVDNLKNELYYKISDLENQIRNLERSY